MAHTLTLIQAWERAESELEKLLKMDGISDDIHAGAVFMLADIYEDRHEYRRAVELLEQIVDTYPNPYAVRYKLDYLKKKF